MGRHDVSLEPYVLGVVPFVESRSAAVRIWILLMLSFFSFAQETVGLPLQPIQAFSTVRPMDADPILLP
jgi:hypothetical protein